MKRDVVRIDDNKCNGCGLCVPNCAEGAIKIIDGKARLVSDTLCDGLGACLGHCPQDAITIEKREARPFEEPPCACPGSQAMDFRGEAKAHVPETAPGKIGSELRQWPVQLHLINPHAPYFKDADLAVIADCVPFAYADFHRRFLKDKALVIFCPKLDDAAEAYVGKLTALFKDNNLKSVTIVHMEVPCCFGVEHIVREAVERSGKNIILKEYTVSLRGEIV
jgi:MinD superfamily P-loop ATPase containing an inserted ferredoxin domain